MSQATTAAIAENLASVRARIAVAAARAGRLPKDVTLLAVTKGVEAAAIRAAYDAGQRHFGENRVQEAQAKLPALVGLSGTTWHMIGSLQTNKVRACLDSFDIIHGVDSAHLAQALNARAKRRTTVYLEVNVTGEGTKHGFLPGGVAAAYNELRGLPLLRIVGLMTVAPQNAEPEAARFVFRRLRQLAGELGLSDLSMGMSGDFEVAVEEGATIVRVGTAIFGQRTPGAAIP